MKHRLLASVLALLPLTVTAQQHDSLDTGVVQFGVFDNGLQGRADGSGCLPVGAGFVFDGENGLRNAVLLVGQDFDQVTGRADSCLVSEYGNTAPLVPITVAGLDQAFETAYEDSAAPNPIGVEVRQRTYSRDGDPYVTISFDVTNVSGGPLSNLNMGLYADWNVGNAAQNLASYDEATQLLYVWDATGTSTNYFGVVAAFNDPGSHPVSGVGFDMAPDVEATLYIGLTFQQPLPQRPSDRRTVLGVGPFDLPAGRTETLRFSFVGGASEGDIIDNAAVAGGCGPCVSNEPSASGTGARLYAPFPNPARGAATLSFALDRPMPVRLSVHDALGREVALLADGPRGAGTHRIAWATEGAAPGVYVVRLATDRALLSRRVVVSR